MQKLLSILIVLLFALPGWGATYYFRSDGNDTRCTGLVDAADTGAGSGQPCAWKTVAKTSSLGTGGDTAYFRGGDTFEYTSASSYILGKASAKYTSYGTGQAKLKVSQTVTGWTNYSGATYVADVTIGTARSCWQNTTTRLIAGSGKDALTAGQYYADAANNKLYVRCTDDGDPSAKTIDYGCQRYAIYSGSNNVTVSNLEIVHGEVAGVSISGAGAIVTGNTIHTCLTAGIDISGAGAIVTGNTIYDIWNGLNYGASGAGAGIAVKAGTGLYARNYIHSCYQSILVSNKAENTIIAYNVFKDAFVNSLDVGSSANTAGNELKLFNNTVLHKPHNTYGTGGHGIAMQGGASGVIWKNNLVAITYASGAYTPNCYSINGSGAQDWSATGRNFQFNNNLCYPIGGIGDYGNILSTQKTLAQWQSYATTAGATGADSAALNSNPTFVSTTDWHLQSGSPAINAGVDVGLTTDADGKPIAGKPDIGAYEYQPTAGIPAGLFIGRRHKHMIQ